MPSCPAIQYMVPSGLWCIASVVSGLSLSGRSGNRFVNSASKIPPDEPAKGTRNGARRKYDVHEADRQMIKRKRQHYHFAVFHIEVKRTDGRSFSWSDNVLVLGSKSFRGCKIHTFECLKKNLNASRPSEHSPARPGEKCQNV